MTARQRTKPPRRKQSNKGQRNLFLTCTWCRKRLQEDDPCWGMGAKARAGVELIPDEGPFLHVPLLTVPGKTVPCAVVPDDSDAKRQGWDLVFMTCSQECGEALRDTLQKEGTLYEVFGSPGRA